MVHMPRASHFTPALKTTQATNATDLSVSACSRVPLLLQNPRKSFAPTPSPGEQCAQYRLNLYFCLDGYISLFQVQRRNIGFTFGYRNIAHGLVQVVRQEGSQALFKGVTARVAHAGPAGAINVALYEYFKHFFFGYFNVPM